MLGLKKQLILSVLLLAFAAPFSLPAQGDDDPRLQQLYSGAKQAQAQGDIPTAIARYEDMLHIAPKLGMAYNNLGALYFRQHEYAKAAEVLERGLKVSPGMPSTAALLGISLFEANEYQRARPVLENAMKAAPNDANIQMYLAKDLSKLGDAAAAAATLQKLAARDPKNQEVFYLMAKVYMQMSEQALARMNAIDPNSVLAHQLSAEVMESMNNYDGAVVELKKAVDLAPQKPGNHYKLGDAYWNLSDWDQAGEQFKTELSIDPGNCLAQAKLGSVLVQKNAAADEILRTLDKALAECPTLADARLDRARTLAKLNRNQEAVSDLEAAAKTTPNDPTIHFLLAKVYRALGRGAEAGQEMQTFSRLDEAARAATAERAQQVIQNKQTAQ